MLHYNLACYACQLGDIEVAKARLAHAFKLEPKCRLEHLRQPGFLIPLHNSSSWDVWCETMLPEV